MAAPGTPTFFYPTGYSAVPGIPYGDGIGKTTATAGTKIRAVVQPFNTNTYSRLTKFVYSNGATAHTLTVMRPIGATTATAASAPAANTITVAGDPGPSGNGLAANDLIVVLEADNVYRVYTVSSYAAGTITITGTLTSGVNIGAAVWDMGVEADTDPFTGRAHETYDLAASAVTTLANEAGMLSTHSIGSPMLLSVNNVTNAGTITQADWGYTVQS